jgi:hypothetical protein
MEIYVSITARGRYARFMADLRTYLAALYRHWKVGVTGGSIAMLLMFFDPLPELFIAAALLGYVVVAGFYAWRDQYQKARARQRRDRESD